MRLAASAIERFNSPKNQLRSDFVEKSARIWLGESKERPEKCVSVVELPRRPSS
jgi:hypothetical protein